MSRISLVSALLLAAACGSDETAPAEDHTPETYSVIVNDSTQTEPYVLTVGQPTRVRIKFFNHAGDDLISERIGLPILLDQPVPGQKPPVLFSLLILAALVMAVVVVITFLLRTAMLALLVGLAPLALTCHATPYTEGLAYTWWRAVGALPIETTASARMIRGKAISTSMTR